MSIVYQSKNVALFKHRVLGLPNGRKTELAIPSAILDHPCLMKCCVREILATDGLLGFYNAAKKKPHVYARIQIRMTARRVIEQIADFLHRYLGVDPSCRINADPSSIRARARHVLQINRSEDIDVWRREIGFSNPSHITRMMVAERLGECPTGTTILDRLAYLSGCSSSLKSLGPLPKSALCSVINKMRREFGSRDLPVNETIDRIRIINAKLQHLARELPRIVELDSVST